MRRRELREHIFKLLFMTQFNSQDEMGEQVQLYGVEITSNFISSFMTDQCDGGAIYTLGANARQDYTDYFNTVSGNFVYADENTWDGQAKIMPYYHDGSSSNWYTAGNILLLTPSRPVRAAFFLQSLKGQETHDILVADNYVIGVCQTAQQRKDGYRLSTEEEEIFLFERDANGQKDAMGLYPSRVDAARGLEQSGNTIFEHPDEVDDLALTIIASSGAPSAPAEADALLAKAAAAYHAYYAQAKD